jgi:hypothetical protein
LAGVPRPEHEFPHLLPDPAVELPFKDTWFLSFHDANADVAGAVHLTLSANRLPGLRTSVALRFGRRSLLETRYSTPVRGDNSFGSDLATLQIVNPDWSPDKHLKLTVRHEVGGEPVELELDLRGRFYGVDSVALTPGLVPSGEGLQALGHAEQAMVASGRLRWGSDEVTVDGPGYRDRSWGYRKSDKMATHGWAFAQLHLSDAACGLLGWRASEASAASAMPVGAWLSDADGVRAATDGLLHLTAEGYLDRLALTFPGRSIDLRATAVRSELHYAFHEPEMDGPALGTICWDQHLTIESGSGPGTALMNLGLPFMADVFRNSRFCFATEPAE